LLLCDHLINSSVFSFMAEEIPFPRFSVRVMSSTCRSFDTIPACDGQTDRQTDRRTDGIAVANTARAMFALRVL